MKTEEKMTTSLDENESEGTAGPDEPGNDAEDDANGSHDTE
jgi:hypothetical protein